MRNASSAKPDQHEEHHQRMDQNAVAERPPLGKQAKAEAAMPIKPYQTTRARGGPALGRPAAGERSLTSSRLFR